MVKAITKDYVESDLRVAIDGDTNTFYAVRKEPENVYIEGPYLSDWYLNNIYATSYSGYIAYVFPYGNIPSNAVRVGTVRNARIHADSPASVAVFRASDAVKTKYVASKAPAWEYMRYTPSTAEEKQRTFLMQVESTSKTIVDDDSKEEE